jgi:2-oxoglutarate ferredoxin oxidoreductase subunit alpha
MYVDYHTGDAELILVAFGYMARCCKEAVVAARSEGINAGLLRPITLWPFPYNTIKSLADRGCSFLVAEDNMGQMIKDVRLGVEGKSEVHLLSASARDIPTDAVIVFPDRVLEAIRKLS